MVSSALWSPKLAVSFAQFHRTMLYSEISCLSMGMSMSGRSEIPSPISWNRSRNSFRVLKEDIKVLWFQLQLFQLLLKEKKRSLSYFIDQCFPSSYKSILVISHTSVIFETDPRSIVFFLTQSKS